MILKNRDSVTNYIVLTDVHVKSLIKYAYYMHYIIKLHLKFLVEYAYIN